MALAPGDPLSKFVPYKHACLPPGWRSKYPSRTGQDRSNAEDFRVVLRAVLLTQLRPPQIHVRNTPRLRARPPHEVIARKHLRSVPQETNKPARAGHAVGRRQQCRLATGNNKQRSAIRGAKTTAQDIDFIGVIRGGEMPGIAPLVKTYRDLPFLRADDRRTATTADYADEFPCCGRAFDFDRYHLRHF